MGPAKIGDEAHAPGESGFGNLRSGPPRQEPVDSVEERAVPTHNLGQRIEQVAAAGRRKEVVIIKHEGREPPLPKIEVFQSK